MIIYEVNLSIDKETYEDFQLWLKLHVNKMLQFPGFIKAFILQPEKENSFEEERLTVHYYLKDRESLTNYFDQYAEKMREEGLKRFKDKFSVQRRILKVEASF